MDKTEAHIIKTIARLWEGREQELRRLVREEVAAALAKRDAEANQFLAETVGADG
jgi:hypothetical protein